MMKLVTNHCSKLLIFFGLCAMIQLHGMDDNVLIEQKEVPMWGQEEISITPEEDGKKLIFTQALAGCTGLAYLAKCANGSKHIMMSHYPPISHEQQLRHLKIAKRRFDWKCDNQVLNKKLIVLVPEDWEKGADGKWVSKPAHPEYIDSLEVAVGLKPDVISYSGAIDMFHAPRGYFNAFRIKAGKNEMSWESLADGYVTHNVEG